MKNKKITLIILLAVIALSLGALLVYKNINSKTTEVNIMTNKRDEYIKQLEVVNDEINIRKDTNTKSEVLGKVKKGDIYTIIEETTDEYYTWYKIKTENNIEGYIAGKYEDSEYIKLLEVKEKESTEENEE